MSKLKLTISLIEKELERSSTYSCLPTGKEHSKAHLEKLLNNHIEEIKGMPQEFIDQSDRGDFWLRHDETAQRAHESYDQVSHRGLSHESHRR
jgi:hypothetical protein